MPPPSPTGSHCSARAPALPRLLRWGEKTPRAFASNTSKTGGENKTPPQLVGKRLVKWFAGCTLPAAISRHGIPPAPPFHSIHGSGDAQGPGWPQNPGWESEATRMTLAARGCGTMAHRPAGMGCRDQHWDGGEGSRQCRGSPAPPQPQPPAPHPHLRELVHTKCPDPDTPTVAPTKCFASTSNSLARKGLGRAFGAFWGLQKCCLCACPAAPWPNRQGKSITAWLLLPSPVPPQLRQLPDREITSKHGREGPKAQG